MTSKKFPLCSKYGLSTLADLEASKVEQALSKAEGERQMNCEACQHDMFRLGEKAGREQGKPATIKQIAEILNNTDQVKFVYIRDMECWLKSQLKTEAKKDGEKV